MPSKEGFKLGQKAIKNHLKPYGFRQINQLYKLVLTWGFLIEYPHYNINSFTRQAMNWLI